MPGSTALIPPSAISTDTADIVELSIVIENETF
jgi:hypothetical protein